jgi:hypothetical protein
MRQLGEFGFEQFDFFAVRDFRSTAAPIKNFVLSLYEEVTD